MRRNVVPFALAVAIATIVVRLAVGLDVDPRLATMAIGAGAIALMLDKRRFHTRMAMILDRCATGRMTLDELLALARRDEEVREGLNAWARKKNSKLRELLEREGLSR